MREKKKLKSMRRKERKALQVVHAAWGSERTGLRLKLLAGKAESQRARH